MHNIIKYSAGGIVVDPQREKILITKKASKNKLLAEMKISLQQLLHIPPEEIIKKLKGSFTKGKINEGETNEMAARKEIEEEGGISPDDLILIKHLGSFNKKKRYGHKVIDMFLYIVEKEYPTLTPTDNKHIAAFIKIKKIIKKIESKEERDFLKSKLEEIENTIIQYKEEKILFTHTKKDVIEVDTGVIR